MVRPERQSMYPLRCPEREVLVAVMAPDLGVGALAGRGPLGVLLAFGRIIGQGRTKSASNKGNYAQKELTHGWRDCPCPRPVGVATPVPTAGKSPKDAGGLTRRRHTLEGCPDAPAFGDLQALAVCELPVLEPNFASQSLAGDKPQVGLDRPLEGAVASEAEHQADVVRYIEARALTQLLDLADHVSGQALSF